MVASSLTNLESLSLSAGLGEEDGEEEEMLDAFRNMKLKKLCLGEPPSSYLFRSLLRNMSDLKEVSVEEVGGDYEDIPLEFGFAHEGSYLFDQKLWVRKFSVNDYLV